MQLLETRKEQRGRRPIQPVMVQLCNERLLFCVQLIFIDKPNAVLLQGIVHFLKRLFKISGIQIIQPVDFLKRFNRPVPFLAYLLILILNNTVERGDPHPEKLIQIIGINAQKTEPFQQRHRFLLCLKQNALVEIHPTDVSFNVILRYPFFCFLHKITVWLLFI